MGLGGAGRSDRMVRDGIGSAARPRTVTATKAACWLGLLVSMLSGCVRPPAVSSAGTTMRDALGNGLAVTAEMRADEHDPDIVRTSARITNERSERVELVAGGCPLTVRAYFHHAGSDSLAWASNAPPRMGAVRERGCPDVKHHIRLEPGGSEMLETTFRMSDIAEVPTRGREYRVLVSVHTVDPRLVTREIPVGVIRLP